MLAHPALELVALGSDSLAGRLPSALDPRLLGLCRCSRPNARGRASGRRRDLPLPRQRAGGGFNPPADTVVVDLSGVHRLADERARAEVVRRRTRRLELRAAGADTRPQGPPDRESRLLRDRGAARARPARGCDRGRASSSTRKSGVTGAGKSLRDSSHAGACSRTSPPTRSAPTGTRPRSPRRSASRSASSRTCCRCAGGCSRPVTCAPTPTCARCSRRPTPKATSSRVLPDGSRARDRPPAGHRRRRDRRLRRQRDRHGDRDLPRSTTSARARPVRRCRTRTSRSGCRETDGTAADGSISYERHCREGIRRLRDRGRDPPARRPRTSRSSARCPPAVGAAMFTRNRVQAACLGESRAHLALADPQAVVINSGVANAATGERGQDRRARDRRRGGTAARPRSRSRCSCSRPGVIGAHLPMHKLLPGLEPAVAALADERRRTTRRRRS